MITQDWCYNKRKVPAGAAAPVVWIERQEKYAHMTNIVNSTLPTQNNHSEKNKPDGVFVIKQGKTNYKVKVFFDHSSGLTAEDRLKRIIQAEAERESA